MKSETTTAEELLLAARAGEPTHTGVKTLVAGNRSGHIALSLVQAGANVCAHVFDCHHARAMRDRLTEAGVDPSAIVHCTAEIPEGPYSRAYFMTTPTSMPAELVLDQLEDIRSQLAVGGELIAAFEGTPDDALKTMKRVFARVHVLPLPDKKALGGVKCVKGVPQVALFRAVKGEKDAAAVRRSFAADWTASVPNGEMRTFQSLPGCFCHRRADPGGQALAEVACAELTAAGKAFGGAFDILDMGCGCGFVGLLVADRLRSLCPTDSKIQLTLLDSHARALAAARVNADRLGFADARLVLADDGLPASEPPAFDLFLGNPPYFGDWRIAETFVSTAFRTLKPGGRCLTVAKSESGLKELQTRIFGEVEVIKRRGYFVFSSIRH